MITAKRVVLSLLLLAWLGLGLYAGRHLAGGLFLIVKATREIHEAPYKSYHTTTPNGYDLQISNGTRETRTTR